MYPTITGDNRIRLKSSDFEIGDSTLTRWDFRKSRKFTKFADCSQISGHFVPHAPLSKSDEITRNSGTLYSHLSRTQREIISAKKRCIYLILKLICN